MSQDELLHFVTDHAVVLVGIAVVFYTVFQVLRMMRSLRSPETLPEGIRTLALVPAASQLGLMFVGEFSAPPWTPATAPLSPLAELKASAAVGEGDYAAVFGPFTLFRDRDLAHVWNLMAGSRGGVAIAIFDFRYTKHTVGSRGRGRSDFDQTVVSLMAPTADLPAFALQPRACRSWVHALSATSFRDIDFPTHPKFNTAFVVSGQDEDAVRRMFADGVLDRLANEPGLEVEAQGQRFVLYRHRHQGDGWSVFGELEEPREIEGLLTQSLDLFGLLQRDNDPRSTIR